MDSSIFLKTEETEWEASSAHYFTAPVRESSLYAPKTVRKKPFSKRVKKMNLPNTSTLIFLIFPNRINAD